ncbi:hypothetical protein [Photobacterium ganghwense]|uniref:hypothetical protein n=1 Tax=Photobacterium ganghwense TaxID=320778 RepID=UPI001A8C99E6|nr:hypothetical protein [Photobacterium ganghwense]QSV17662.1 hypothetical protein FH974_25610 [Photobacterium ganghwense]
MQKKRFYIEVAVRQFALLLFIVPFLFRCTFDSMRQMEQGNQSAILTAIGLLMAAGIIGVFEATYQKTLLSNVLQRSLAHLTKLLLFIGISEIIILAIAAIGITSTVWDDPLLWAVLPIYVSLYIYDWWDTSIAASRLERECSSLDETEVSSGSEPQVQEYTKPDDCHSKQ